MKFEARKKEEKKKKQANKQTRTYSSILSRNSIYENICRYSINFAVCLAKQLQNKNSAEPDVLIERTNSSRNMNYKPQLDYEHLLETKL